MLVDTHVHLNLDPLFERWPAVVAEAKLAGVERFVVPGADIPSSERAVQISKEEPSVFAAVGIHPETLLDSPLYDVSEISTLASCPTVVGIGEIGLDYFRNHAPVEIQRNLFKDQLAVAKEQQLPAIIHSRTDEAMQDTVSDIRFVYGTTPFRGVFHCFSGSRGFFETISNMGCLIGVGGMITYDHQVALQQVIASVPLSSIILETDAPWLMPQPRPRGTNTPANVTIVAVKLASLLQVQLTEVLETTSRNVHRLFPQLGLNV